MMTPVPKSGWRADTCTAAVPPPTTTIATIAQRMPFCPLPTAHRALPAARCQLIRGRLISLEQPLARLVDVALEHEQVVRVPHRVGEVVLLAALALHLQVLVEIVHLEHDQARARHR